MKSGMFWCLFVVALGLTLPPRAAALLGETEAQLESRYGKAIPELTDHLEPGLVVDFYLVRGVIAATVFVLDGRSAGEAYFRAAGQKLPEHTVAAMLKGNAHGQRWTRSGRWGDFDRSWRLQRNGTVAAHGKIGKRDTFWVMKPALFPHMRRFVASLEAGRRRTAR